MFLALYRPFLHRHERRSGGVRRPAPYDACRTLAWPCRTRITLRCRTLAWSAVEIPWPRPALLLAVGPLKITGLTLRTLIISCRLTLSLWTLEIARLPLWTLIIARLPLLPPWTLKFSLCRLRNFFLRFYMGLLCPRLLFFRFFSL